MSDNNKENGRKTIYIIVAVIVFAAASLVGGLVVAPIIKEKRANGTVTAKASDAYAALLADNGIPDVPVGFDGLKSASYAVTTGEDSFETVELGYKKDVVVEMYDTLYYSVDGMTDEEYADFDETVRNRAEAVANENYCTYTTEKTDGKYKLVMHFYALDEPQNVRDLITLGIISNYSDNQNDSVSLKDTENSFSRMGFVKR